MSIKPYGYMWAGIFIPANGSQPWHRKDGIALYAIHDTHQIMPVRLTDKMIAAAIPELMREDDEDKYRALGQLICVWDELGEAVKEEQP